MLNRRSFLRAAPAAGVALTVPAVAIAEKPVMTARERLDAAIAELKAAAAEIWPTADDWEVLVDGRPSIPLLLSVYDSKRGVVKAHFDVGPLLAEDAGCHKVLADLERRVPA
ncbi:twin-arginine translocation signal domain-containing protein [Brucella sp. BE17]|uniref:twin-arginine translocation signal domain-containing protein n=1 Tax=Brucella sp. BE17 TaxID=3142977 RepID=UPI0031BA4A1D